MEIVQRFSFSTVESGTNQTRDNGSIGIKMDAVAWVGRLKKVFLNDDLDFFQKMIGLWFVSP